jgi:U3 small nucleolar RNA-associated protein 7
LNDFGPYSVDYTHNGSHLLLAGKKGHMATMDWRSGKLFGEVHLKESTYDCKWLHNETMFALAQRKYVYIYDRECMEIHRLTNHTEALKLDYLRYHFLLTSIGNNGILRYHDTSTGELVAELKTKMGRCEIMTNNPSNAIVHLGHANGVVSLWTPNLTSPVVKMLCHKGPVTAVAVENGGNYMTTAGLDGQMKVWDIRKFQPVHQYYTFSPAKSLSISQKGLLAVGFGPNVTIWRNALKTKQVTPYMNHLQPSSAVTDVMFCPYEDILGVGHTKGFSSLIIPGAGEANYDALEANPYQTKKQRQEAEVKALLDKLQPNMITINPDDIGNVDQSKVEVIVPDKKQDHFKRKVKRKRRTKGKIIRNKEKSKEQS